MSTKAKGGTGLGTLALIALGAWIFAGGGNVSDQASPRHITVSGRWPSDAHGAKVSWRITGRHGGRYGDDFTAPAGTATFSETRTVPVDVYGVSVSVRPAGTVGDTVVAVSWPGGDKPKKSAPDFPEQGAQLFITVTIAP